MIFIFILFPKRNRMLNRLTPVVLNIIIINVIVFVGLMFVDKVNPEIRDYFLLHKSNALGLRKTAIVGYEEVYLPAYSPVEGKSGWVNVIPTTEDMQQFLAAFPEKKQEILDSSMRPAQFNPIQIVTHFFNHSESNLFHILFNMLALASIGPLIEMVLHAKRFLKFYLFCGVVGGMMIAFLDPSNGPVVGASGAISGVLVAFAIYFPRQKLSFFFLPGIESRYLVTGIGVLSAVLVFLNWVGVDLGAAGMLSHFGHLSGMLAALLFFYAAKYIPFLNQI